MIETFFCLGGVVLIAHVFGFIFAPSRDDEVGRSVVESVEGNMLPTISRQDDDGSGWIETKTGWMRWLVKDGKRIRY